jgi:glycosyltransferase involved in cell wall biosynthesis
MSGSDRPTVLFINHWAASMGGAEHSLLDILLFMAGRCDCHLVTSEDGVLAERAQAAGVTSHIVPCAMRKRTFLRAKILSTVLFSLPDILLFLRYVLGVRGLVNRLGPTLIHANVPKSHVALFCLRMLGYRGVCCFHIRELFAEGGSVPALLYGALFPRHHGMAIAISQAVHRSLPKRMREKSSVIYNGVRVQNQPKALGHDHEGMRFLYCGRIVPWKGCHLLVEMFHEAKTKFPSVVMEMSLVGDTSYWSPEYREQLSANIRDRGLETCCFLRPDTEDVQALYDGHDVFVNASYREPFGRSIAEAQGAGMAVVSFDSGGVAEIVEKGVTGFLPPYGDKESFVKALIECAQRPQHAAAMGEKGRKRAELLFNSDIQVPKICDFMAVALR